MKKILGIFGVPRSGTSWLGQIFNSSADTYFAYQPMFTERFRNKINAYSTEQEMRNYLLDIYKERTDFLQQKDGKDKSNILQFQKLSENPDCFVFKEAMYLYMIPQFLRNLPEIKVIYLLRNPYAVLQSWYNAPKEFYPEWDIEKEWLFAEKKNGYLPERYYGYHRWKESISLASSLQQEFSERVYIIRYEDLDDNPEKWVKEMFGFAELSYDRQTKEFIKASREKTEDDPYSVFRRPQDRGNGKKALPTNIVEQINYDLSKFSLANIWYNAADLYHRYSKSETEAE
jgi:hypothetical protein